MPRAWILTSALLVAWCGCVAPPEGGWEDSPQLEMLERLRRLECLHNGYCRSADDPTLERVRNALANGRLAIDPEELEVCAASTDRVVFDVRDDQPTSRASPCVRLWIGSTSALEGCDLDTACEAGHFCDRADDSRSLAPHVTAACGVCRPCAPLGEACHESGGGQFECDEGLYCQHDVCLAPTAPRWAAAGDPCGEWDDLECGPDLWCRPVSNEGFELVCGPRVEEGGPCASAWDCTSGLTCEMGYPFGTCIPTELGSSCAPFPGCRDGLVCAETEIYQYACAHPVARGEPCLDSVQCPDEHVCIDGACGRILAPDDACEPPDKCAAGSECVSGTCRFLPIDGQLCRDECAGAATCVDGWCTPPEDPYEDLCDWPFQNDSCSELGKYCKRGAECVPICFVLAQ